MVVDATGPNRVFEPRNIDLSGSPVEALPTAAFGSLKDLIGLGGGFTAG
ncbi:MAG: hypothetical protein ACFCVK_09910 [Acidimicrobiales bacterium]